MISVMAVALHYLQDRLANDRGQTSAEMLGLIVIVGGIIFAISTSDLAANIANGFTNLIADILGGGSEPGS